MENVIKGAPAKRLLQVHHNDVVEVADFISQNTRELQILVEDVVSPWYDPY